MNIKVKTNLGATLEAKNANLLMFLQKSLHYETLHAAPLNPQQNITDESQNLVSTSCKTNQNPNTMMILISNLNA